MVTRYKKTFAESLQVHLKGSKNFRQVFKNKMFFADLKIQPNL